MVKVTVENAIPFMETLFDCQPFAISSALPITGDTPRGSGNPESHHLTRVAEGGKGLGAFDPSCYQLYHSTSLFISAMSNVMSTDKMSYAQAASRQKGSIPDPPLEQVTRNAPSAIGTVSHPRPGLDPATPLPKNGLLCKNYVVPIDQLRELFHIDQNSGARCYVLPDFRDLSGFVERTNGQLVHQINRGSGHWASIRVQLRIALVRDGDVLGWMQKFHDDIVKGPFSRKLGLLNRVWRMASLTAMTVLPELEAASPVGATGVDFSSGLIVNIPAPVYAELT